MSIHESAVITKPSFENISLLSVLQERVSAYPSNKEIAIVMRKAT